MGKKNGNEGSSDWGYKVVDVVVVFASAFSLISRREVNLTLFVALCNSKRQLRHEQGCVQVNHGKDWAYEVYQQA
jgi:hypothetical protein